MTGWVCQWKTLIVNATSKQSNSENQGDVIPETPNAQDTACSWERIEAPLPLLQKRSTCERLELPFSCDAILSGYEDLVSSGSDHFTVWGKMSPHEILAENVVDIHKVLADSVTLFERNQSSSSQSKSVNKYFSSQSPVQKRLSIYNWNPGPRRGKEDAFEKQIAGKWHIVTLQEASDYVEHDILQERFHVTHFAGCAIFFNKDTFNPDI